MESSQFKRLVNLLDDAGEQLALAEAQLKQCRILLNQLVIEEVRKKSIVEKYNIIEFE